jgi:3'-5' exoribonuclease
MKPPTVGELVPNEIVTAHFLVIAKEIRQKKTGEPYLSLHLADKTGEIEAKMWDNVAEVMDTFDRDDFVKVKGITQVYQNRSQFTIHKLRLLEDHEVQFADFYPCSERDPEEMFTELLRIIASIGNPHLRGLLDAVFKDNEIASLYKLAPAAKAIHHAWRGGLLEHVLSLCALAKVTGPHYPAVDLDLLLTGAILHDLGKVEELTYARSFGYSASGQLLGHIVLGLRLLGRKFDSLPDFPPKLRALVEHIVVSHHGELEYGSPKVPIFAEALLFHHLDNLDSKMNAMECALKRDRGVEGEFTGWIGSLERVLLKKDRYLEALGAKPEPAARTAEPSQNAATPAPEAAGEGFASDAPKLPELLPEPPTAKRAIPQQQPINSLFAEKLQAVLGPPK